MVYALSFLFSTSSSAYARFDEWNELCAVLLCYGLCRLCIMFVFGGIGMLITIFVISIPVFDLVNTAKVLKYVFFFHPGYAVGQVGGI